jgi:thiol-disulfide isomerase/thioredoxin
MRRTRRTRISNELKEEATNSDKPVQMNGGKRHRRRTLKNKMFRTKSLNDLHNKPSIVNWETVNDEISTLGEDHLKVKKFKKNIGDVTHKIVYGKLWMTGCGYCIDVHPIWEKVVESLTGDDRYINVDIRNDNIDSGISALKSGTSATVRADGYPTFYKIVNSKVVYYSGDRTVPSMKNWLLSNSFSV